MTTVVAALEASEPRTRELGWSVVAVLGVFVAIALLTQSRLPVHHDTAWLLYVAEQVRSGARLYSDIWEINPPLIVWLNVLVVATADATAVASATLYCGLVSTLAVLSTWVTSRVWPHCPRWVLPATAFVLLVLPWRSFGQREHIVLCLVLPAVAVLARRLTRCRVSPRLALVSGTGFGLAMALKPFFLAIFGLAILVDAARTRRLVELARVEYIAATSIGVGYVVAVAAWTPDFFKLTRLLGGLYFEWLQRPFWYAFGDRPVLVGLATAAAWLLSRAFTRERAGGDALFAAVIGCAIGYVAQVKGFSYHAYPLLGSSFLLAAQLATRRGFSRAAGAVLLLATTVAAFAERPHVPPPGLERVVRSVPEPAVVLVLTHRVRDAWPLILEAHAVSASRLPSSWWLAALYREELSRPGPVVTRAPEEMSQLESRLFEMTIQDVVRRPDVIITWRPTSELWGRGRLHVMEYLMQDARAAAALQDYQREPVGPFVVWKRDAHTF